MKKTILNLSIAAVLLQPMIYINDVNAEKGDFVVRVRATNISPDEDSDLYDETQKSTGLASTLYGANSGAELSVESNTIPEIDFSYYWTKNFATELILAIGSRHDVSVVGSSGNIDKDLGSVNLLPPTLTGQWHFRPDQSFDPYIGAGISYVRAMDNRLEDHVNNLSIRIDRNRLAPVLQIGADINLESNWMVNVDLKKFWYNTDDETKGAATSYNWVKIDDLDVDPWVSSIGVGYRF